MTFTVYDDFLINFNLGYDGAVRCHGNLSFEMNNVGDIQYTSSAAQAVLQKLFILMSIKPGEVPGEPDLGFCMYKYFFKKSTPSNYALLQRELYDQLTNFIPEMGVESVTCQGSEQTTGTIDGVQINVLTKDFGRIDLSVTKGNLEALVEAQENLFNTIGLIEQNNM